MMALLTSLDGSIEQALYAARTPMGVRAFSLLTELGGAIAIVAITVLAGLFLWRKGYTNCAAGLLVSVGGAIASSELLKMLVQRARPPIEWHAVVESSSSFPSNHATAAAALYGFLAYAAWQLAPQRWRGILVALCVMIVTLVGFSRLYLGVHYPTDVLGGFVIGALFVLAGVHVAKKIRAHRSG